MNDILYTVHVDGTDKKFKKGTTYQEIARTYQQEYQHDIVLVFGSFHTVGEFLEYLA